MSDERNTIPRRADRIDKDYCVLCGAIFDGLNGVDTCRKSECDLSHLWARVGYVEDWFPVKRVYGPSGGVRAA